jgi:hypothetical protein
MKKFMIVAIALASTVAFATNHEKGDKKAEHHEACKGKTGKDLEACDKEHAAHHGDHHDAKHDAKKH